MREFLGRKGNLVYLINLDTNESAVFNKFGSQESLTTGVLGYADIKYPVEIDLLSLLGDPMTNMCEVYLVGKKGVIPLCYTTVLARLSGRLSLEEPVVYRIVHSQQVMQVLLPVRKGTLTPEKLATMLGVSISWKFLRE